jgi:hypothetical protein
MGATDNINSPTIRESLWEEHRGRNAELSGEVFFDFGTGS